MNHHTEPLSPVALVWVTFFDGDNYHCQVFPEPNAFENKFSPSLYGLDSDVTICSVVSGADPTQASWTLNQHITFSR